MTNKQPKPYDLVLGGQTPTPITGAVLGGLAGVKRRFSPKNTNSLEQRLDALKDVLNYGSEGLELAVEALNDPSFRVQRTAYALLQRCNEPSIIEALQAYNPYQFFQCRYRHSTGRSTTYAIAMSPDGQLIISGGSDRAVTIRDLDTGKILGTLTGHSGSIFDLCLSRDGKILVTGSRDTTVKVWNLDVDSEPNAVSPTTRVIGNQLLQTLRGHVDSVNAVAISPDGTMMASGSEDQTISLWTVERGELLATLEGHEGGIRSLAISPDGELLVSGSTDTTIKLWQLPRPGNDAICPDPIYTITGHGDWVNCLAISPDGQWLASGSQDKTIMLWQLETAQLKHTLTGHWGEVNSLAFSADGQTLTSCSWDETICLWQVASGKLLYSLTGHQGAIACVVISPQGQPLVSSSWDRTIRVWGMVE